MNNWLKTFPSQNTRRAYRTTIDKFQTWAGIDISNVNAYIVQRYITHLRAIGNVDRTINQKLAACHSYYEYILAQTDDGFTGDKANPFDARRIKRAKINPRGRAKFPTIQQMLTLLKTINRKSLRGKRDYALIRLYLVTSRRSAEILNLRWGDIRPIGGGEFAFRYTNKGGTQREAVLSHHLYNDIFQYLQAVGRFPLTPDEYIFIAISPERATRLPHVPKPITPKPITNSFVNQMLKARARKAGINPALAHVHALRHLGARMRVEQMRKNGGVDYEEIRQLLGHTSLRTTQIYIEEIIGDPKDPGLKDAVAAWSI